MEVQAGYLKQVRDLAGKLPVLCAGDIFDRWNPSPEVIHFALRYLPDEMICVPGQHDLPNHRIADIHRSGYGVLAQCEKILDISGIPLHVGDSFIVHGFGWEQEIGKPEPRTTSLPHIALVHRYCWTKDKSFPGAAEQDNVAAFEKRLRGYSVAVFGDNHKHFMAQAGKCLVYNCGGFIRRKSDEIGNVPRVGLLHSDMTIEKVSLDTSKDAFHEEAADKEEVPVNLQDFLSQLDRLGDCGLDFREAVRNHLKTEDIKPKVKQLVLEALEQTK